MIILLNVVYHFLHFGKNGLEVTRMELHSGNLNELVNTIYELSLVYIFDFITGNVCPFLFTSIFTK